MNIDGRRKAKMAQNDQPVPERDENCKGEEDCGGAPVSPPEECQDAPASTNLHAADLVLSNGAKAIEIEDVEARVSELERPAEEVKNNW